jgi:hypothetical protein
MIARRSSSNVAFEPSLHVQVRERIVSLLGLSLLREPRMDMKQRALRQKDDLYRKFDSLLFRYIV